jgi:tripeptidyl-peptidase-1
MKIKSILFFFIFFISLELLESFSINENQREVLYKRSNVPINGQWNIIGNSASDELVSFTLALKQYNIDKLESAFYENSDPHSTYFTKHWNKNKILDLIAPPKEVTKKIFDWIDLVTKKVGSNQIISIVNNRDAITIRSTVLFAEMLFRTQMYKFENRITKKVVIKHLGDLSVPVSISQHIDLVTGITELNPTNHQIKRLGNQRAEEDNQCNTPYTIKELYGVPQNLTVTNKESNQSIYAEDSNHIDEGFGFNSIAYWEKSNGIPPNPINCILGDGADYIFPNDTDDEAQLDTQMMTGMAVGAKTCFWIIEGWMFEFAQQYFNDPSTPLVVSISYGWQEDEQCINETNEYYFLGNCTAAHIPNSFQYVNRTNIEFMKIGLLGRTIIVASGDDGDAGGHESENGCTIISPTFPASSPYVTSVGATSLEPSNSNFVDKKGSSTGLPPLCTNPDFQCVCSTSRNEQQAEGNNTAGFDSGGGFSNIAKRPKYQNQAISDYFKSGVYLPPASFKWNSAGRGYPDVGAIGENFCVVDSDSPCSLAAGTSASAPLFASLVTLLNQDRLNAGKNPLGFLNQIIYDMFYASHSQYFKNDFRPSSNGGECGDAFGFHQKSGYWSPITGVGSPKFAAIRKYIQNLP